MAFPQRREQLFKKPSAGQLEALGDYYRRNARGNAGPISNLKSEYKTFGLKRFASGYAGKVISAVLPTGFSLVAGLVLPKPPSLEEAKWKTRYALAEYAKRPTALNALNRAQPLALNAEQLARFKTLARPGGGYPANAMQREFMKLERAKSRPLFEGHRA